jgi:DNA-binding HxlR family transcriptional regulator
MSVVEAATKISKEHSALSNVYRTMTLGYLDVKKRGSWSDIKKFLEGQVGPVNPNTLHFHLKALVENGFIVATGSQEKPVYQIGVLSPEIRQSISHITKLIERA